MKSPLVVITAVLVIAAGAAAQEKQAEAPSVPSEQPLTGTTDIGYRWIGGVGGDYNTYRSVVNLGSGPKLFGLDWSLKGPSNRLFDTADFRASSWGGEPYGTAQVDVRRQRAYRLLFDYRKIAYFNFLPSFANPGRERGSLLDERSFDTFRRTADLRLTLLPSRRISPYFGYLRNSGAGTGSLAFFGGGNEFPVGSRLRDHSDVYRAGVQMNLRLIHVTLEQGGSIFRNDQQIFNSQVNAGNIHSRFQPFLGDLLQAYGVRGTGLFSRALFTSAPASWLSLFGQFLYSRPRTSANYTQTASTLFLYSGTPFSTTERVLVSSDARLPHSSGSFGVELRPARRVRITESWMTDRLHDASAALLTDQFLLPTPAGIAQVSSLADRLAWDYSQHEVNLLFDLGPHFTFRGGHRYSWGTATVRATRARPATPFESGDLRRQVALAGASVHAGQRFSMNFDLEASSGERTLFRTGLQDYDRMSVRARYQPVRSLTLSANFFALRNENPAPGIGNQFLSRQNSVSATWTPSHGSKVSVTTEYSRVTLRSRLNYITPATLVPELSLYRDNGHIGSSVVTLALPAHGIRPSLSAGGSFFVSSGSRPTHYYQPLGRLLLPLGKHIEWNSEWRWYALSQPFYLFEGFRVHQLMTALRWKM